jgi:hypothetical protein
VIAPPLDLKEMVKLDQMCLHIHIYGARIEEEKPKLTSVKRILALLLKTAWSMRAAIMDDAAAWYGGSHPAF